MWKQKDGLECYSSGPGKKRWWLEMGDRNEESGKWQSGDSHSGPDFKTVFFSIVSHCLLSPGIHHNLAIIQ